MRRWKIAWSALLLLVTVGQPLPATAAQPAPPGTVYRSEELYLEVELPKGWAIADEPWMLTGSFTGLLAFNSWGEAGFRTPGMDRDNVLVYRPKWKRRSLPWDAALVTLAEVQDGGLLWHAENYGPEWEGQDLRGLWPGGDCRAGQGATQVRFQKWGRSLLLEVLCQPDASAETARAVSRLLNSWRFDTVPAGDAGWAVLEARALLPRVALPERFPLLKGRLTPAQPARSAWTDDGVLRSTAARLEGEMVVVTFHTGRTVAGGRQERRPDQYPGGRGGTAAHRWRFEVEPDGSVTRAGEGGAAPPAREVEGWEQAAARPARPLALYHDPAMGFSLQYPSDWQLQEFTRWGGAPQVTFVAGSLPPGQMYRDLLYVLAWPSPPAGEDGTVTHPTSSFLSVASAEVRDEFVAGCPEDAAVRSFELCTTSMGQPVLVGTQGGWHHELWIDLRSPGGRGSPFEVMLCSFALLSPHPEPDSAAPSSVVRSFS